MKIAIIDKISHVIYSTYDDSAPNQAKFGGPWGNPGVTSHVAMPDGVASTSLTIAVDGAGVFTLTLQDVGKRSENKTAKDAFAITRTAQCETEIAAILVAATSQDADPTTHLMVVARVNDIQANSASYSKAKTADTTTASDVLANCASSDLVVGMDVTGPGIPAATRILAIVTATSVRLNKPATATATGAALTFKQDTNAAETLAVYRPCYVSIQASRAARDAAIAAFVPPYASVSPLYPA